MEDALALSVWRRYIRLRQVLILVVMEDALALTYKNKYNKIAFRS